MQKRRAFLFADMVDILKFTNLQEVFSKGWEVLL